MNSETYASAVPGKASDELWSNEDLDPAAIRVLNEIQTWLDVQATAVTGFVVLDDVPATARLKPRWYLVNPQTGLVASDVPSIAALMRESESSS